MSKQQTVIYHARTPQEAHLLRNLLAEEQIEAVVLGAALEDGLGGDALGWAALAQVAVAQDDAQRARQIALEFDKKAASGSDRRLAASGPEQEGPLPEAPAMVSQSWPRCPECGAPRSTRCPICGTAGSNFQPADAGFTWMAELADAARDAPSGSCGPGGCTPAAEQAEVPEAEESEAEQSEGEQSEAEAPAKLLMCPTCDEPFAPEYPRLCEWCGHEFPDGFEVPLPEGPVEQVNRRMIAVIVGLLLAAAAMAAYLMFIVG
jgi:hypothetical protein